MRGQTAPRCSVTNSTLPAAVTAASTATASPPQPEEALGGPPGIPSIPTPTATGQTENVVTLCGSICSRPTSCGRVVPVAAGAAALAVLEGTAMLKAVGSIVGALGKAGAAFSSSNRLCKGASHCHT